MLRKTLAAAIVVTAASGGMAMAQAAKTTTHGQHIDDMVITVADNAAPAPKDPLNTDQTEKFREEVRKGNHPSYKNKIDVKVGTILPDDVEFYAAGAQWNMSDYKYALIGDKTVIVEAKTRKVVQILDEKKDVTKAKQGTADK